MNARHPGVGVVRCPTCGSTVHVATGDEGTSSYVTEDRAAPSPDALLVTRESLAAAFHEEYRDGDFGCRHHGNQHHASWDCWGHANDIFDALFGESR